MKRKPNGYWTYEKCKEEALKYNNKSEFRKKCISALSAIRRNKWFELFNNMQCIKPKGYWTYDRCKEEAIKYSNLSDLFGTSLYKIIKQNKWDSLLSHVKISKRPNGYWTYEKCKEEAIKYNKKNIFQKEKSSAYKYISKNKWFELYDHMIVQGNRYKRLIYVFEFSDKSCYIGLTGNIKRREKQHLLQDFNSSVFKHILETNLKPVLILKSDYIDVEDAIKMENIILNEYNSNNWIILNKAKTGGIGSCNLKWTKEMCKIESLKYIKITEYQTASKSSYNAALKNGWIDEVCSHMNRCKSKNGYWNDKELCRKEALKYNSISELHKNCWSAYNYSKVNGWLYEFFS
jgi:predicted GIY-YIG superfamily endonuclease